MAYTISVRDCNRKVYISVWIYLSDDEIAHKKDTVKDSLLLYTCIEVLRFVPAAERRGRGEASKWRRY